MRIALDQALSVAGSMQVFDAAQIDPDHSDDDRPAPVSGVDVQVPAGGAAPLRGGAPDSGALAVERRLRRSLASESTDALADAAAPNSISSSGPAPPRMVAAAQQADAAVLERLNVALTEWVDEGKARSYADSPSDLLLAVAKHRGREIPDAFKVTLDPSLLADEAVLDEAAVLYDRLHRPAPAAGESGEPRVSLTLSALRATFVNALSNDYSDRHMLDALLVPSPSLGQPTPYFDGFALRNAEGQSFDTLLDREDVWSDLAVAVLAPIERRALLARKFDEMRESTRFPIGSTAHSMATALLRIARYGGSDPSDTDNEADVVASFAKIEGEWHEGNAYPYHPRRLFAAHLARSSGFEAITQEQLRMLYEDQVKGPALEARANGNIGPSDWIGLHLGGWGAGGASWRATPARRTQALLWLFDALRTAADRDGPISALARDLKAKGVLTPIRFVGADSDACAAAVLEYGNDRLIMAYGKPPPSFDRREAASSILRRFGLDDTSLTDARRRSRDGDRIAPCPGKRVRDVGQHRAGPRGRL